MNKTVAVAFLLALSLPFLGVLPVTAEAEWAQFKVGDTFTLTSTKGFVAIAQAGKIARKNASLTFTVQITEAGERWVKFHVASGTVTIDGQPIAIVSVDGRVRVAPRLRGAAIALQGSVTNGELRLNGRIHKQDGKLIFGLGGWIAVGDSLYPLRLWGTASR